MSGGKQDPGARAIDLVRKRDSAAAQPLLRRAMRLPGAGPELPFALALSHFQLGDVTAAVRVLKRLAESSNPRVRRAALGKIAIFIPGDPRADNKQILEARRRWARVEARTELRRVPTSPRRRKRGRKLRVGYVSAFFDCRNWMKPVWRTLAAHDRRFFEIHLFVERGMPSRTQGYRQDRRDRVHLLDNLSNEAAAKRVSAARIDVLVDLNAYSFPWRFGLFCRRPAPVQVGWFNTYSTSGFGAFDYAVADRTALPVAERRFCSEEIAYVDGSYLAFAVPYRVPRVVMRSARSGRFTFGCLAPQYKITGNVVHSFAAILRGVPGARLILKNTCLAKAANRAAIRDRFLRLGVSRDQLLLEGPADHFAFLKTYGRIDIALDTFPYSGGVTTMEALWQGVPVLTQVGDRWASRTSSSILKAAGLDEWICRSARSLVRRAITLAGSRGARQNLAAVRASLREKLRLSAACDVGGLCRQLEDHYRSMAFAPKGER
jgi:predicted O-linked N-acetylglucosamine transferase (SPINDLY family)